MTKEEMREEIEAIAGDVSSEILEVVDRYLLKFTQLSNEWREEAEEYSWIRKTLISCADELKLKINEFMKDNEKRGEKVPQTLQEANARLKSSLSNLGNEIKRFI